MKPEFKLLDRREFVNFVSRSAALLGLAKVGSESATAATTSAEQTSTNAFAYDVSRLQKTDPKLIAYEEVTRWRSPRTSVRQIAIGPGDQVHVCAGHYISVFNPQGQPAAEVALTGPADSLAVASDGTIYAGLRDHVEVFDAKGQRQAVWAAPDRKSWLTGLAVGKQDVFAADSGKRVIWHFDLAGKLLGRVGEKNASQNAPGFIVPSPFLQVAIHADGLLRVNNIGRHQVEAYTFAGEFEGAWGRITTAIDGFCGCCNPIGFALLPDGRFVTAEKGLPRVKIYNLAGVFESVVAGAESFPENARACNGLNDCAHGGLDVGVDGQGTAGQGGARQGKQIVA